MMVDQISDFLKTRVGLFQHISDNRLADILHGSKVLSYEPNETVVSFGEEASFLGVLLEGELSVSAVADDGSPKEIAHFTAGDTFGEMALLSGDKIVFDYIAETRCQVLRIPVDLFQSVIMTEPDALQHVSKTVIERLKEVSADPDKAAAAFRESTDPYGLQLKGERPEKILVINCGSSSLKYTFFDTENESSTARGQVERIGIAGTNLTHRGPSGEVKRDLAGGGYEEAFKAMLQELTSADNGVIRDPSEITVVGHRVVHGGEKFSEAIVIDDKILEEIDALSHLAPLHNPVNVAGIKAARRIFPGSSPCGRFRHGLPLNPAILCLSLWVAL